jgi:hypothetical protein
MQDHLSQTGSLAAVGSSGLLGGFFICSRLVSSITNSSHSGGRTKPHDKRTNHCSRKRLGKGRSRSRLPNRIPSEADRSPIPGQACQFVPRLRLATCRPASVETLPRCVRTETTVPRSRSGTTVHPAQACARPVARSSRVVLRNQRELLMPLQGDDFSCHAPNKGLDRSG